MRLRIGAVSAAAILATSCIAYADDDRDHGGDGRSKAEARAERQCEREAEDRGLRVRGVGDAERVGKKEYEVRLRVDDRDDRRKKKDDDFRVLCRYDDRSRRASIY
jgi:hypothetical protein